MGFLLWLSAALSRPAQAGDLFLIYLIGYPIGRFLLEFLRLDASAGWRDQCQPDRHGGGRRPGRRAACCTGGTARRAQPGPEPADQNTADAGLKSIGDRTE